MKFVKTLAILFLVASCAPIYVNYDYEKGTDFTKYKSYNYYADMKTGLSELDTKRLLNALDEQLQAKGFALSDTPDFFIDIKSTEFQGAQRQTVGVGVGGGGGNVGGGISIGLPLGQAQVTRQITVDFVDENIKQLYWQAVSESSFNPNSSPEKREARLSAIVAKILKKYPPKN
ncbi:DUF4136 domain-containing protein [Algibacter lectus]|uniref:Lipoprotein putative n=1 Tax=Algibacter lectus TaxID=221126 RepID=A0A090W4L3_9FLAO|nr:DUF4136 domain-containing protein [Algibacter lectus]MDO7137878.1 DUF4136 domain-containing protein [Algibacter lectus]MWW26153.1 DUF4136 domain-containing protein [Algibacter lectus]TDY60371.1 uncharacterized protein DUF4136 [Algibacter lectus]GAL62442.1 lipoprotein putative [Algibacter lectus]